MGVAIHQANGGVSASLPVDDADCGGIEEDAGRGGDGHFEGSGEQGFDGTDMRDQGERLPGVGYRKMFNIRLDPLLHRGETFAVWWCKCRVIYPCVQELHFPFTARQYLGPAQSFPCSKIAFAQLRRALYRELMGSGQGTCSHISALEWTAIDRCNGQRSQGVCQLRRLAFASRAQNIIARPNKAKFAISQRLTMAYKKKARCRQEFSQPSSDFIWADRLLLILT